MTTVVTYELSATARCWRLHDCVRCGCAYRYLCERKVSAVAGTAEVATAKANLAAAAALEEAVETHPCPQCGLVQPYMTAHKKYHRHLLVTVLAVGVAAAGVGIASADRVPGEAVGLLVAVVAALAAASHLLIALANPNWSGTRNLLAAQREVAGGRVQVVRKGETDDDDPRCRIFTPGHAFYLLLAFAAVAAGLAPVAAARANGWHWNHDLGPGLIAPGDTVRVAFPEQVDSAKGLWAGHPVVTVENAAEFGDAVPQVTARSRAESWGKLSGAQNEQSGLWADVVLPDDPALAGRTLNLRVEMKVAYPRSGIGKVTEETMTVSRSLAVRVSPAGARAEERAYRLAGTGAAAGLVFLSGLGLTGLAWQLRRRCSPGLMQHYGDMGRVELQGFGESRATMFNNAAPDAEPATPDPPAASKPWARW